MYTLDSGINVAPWINVAPSQKISHQNFLLFYIIAAFFSFLKLKIVATIGIFYNFQIQTRIVSAETICGNTVYW